MNLLLFFLLWITKQINTKRDNLTKKSVKFRYHHTYKFPYLSLNKIRKWLGIFSKPEILGFYCGFQKNWFIWENKERRKKAPWNHGTRPFDRQPFYRQSFTDSHFVDKHFTDDHFTDNQFDRHDHLTYNYFIVLLTNYWDNLFLLMICIKNTILTYMKNYLDKNNCRVSVK